jgi:LPS-assembly lipoprotein
MMRSRSATALTLIAALIAAVLLSACGFQLRGSNGRNAIPFNTVFVGFPENSPVGAELKRYLRAGDHTTIVSDPKAAEADIELLSETRNKVVLTLNSQGRVREYSLLYSVNFRVKNNQGQDLLGPTQIALKRDITFNESQVMAKEKEEEMLYRDMQSDAVQQILRRLSALKPAA